MWLIFYVIKPYKSGSNLIYQKQLPEIHCIDPRSHEFIGSYVHPVKDHILSSSNYKKYVVELKG
jgi:hypothetical protein